MTHGAGPANGAAGRSAWRIRQGARAKLRSSRPDFATIGGVVVAIGSLLGGLILDGGKVSDVTQVTAAIIVLGGTLGAVMVTSPLSSLIAAAGGLKNVFFEEVVSPEAAIDEIVAYATKARKSSLISLEEDLDKIDDPFLQKDADSGRRRHRSSGTPQDDRPGPGAGGEAVRSAAPRCSKRRAAIRRPSASSAP